MTLHPKMCSRCESRSGGTGINCSRVLEVWACQVAHMVVGSVGFVGSDSGWAPPVGGRESRTDDQHPPPCEVSRSPLSQRRTADRPARTGTPTLEPELLKDTFSIKRKTSKSGRFSLLPPPLVTRPRLSNVFFLVNEASDVGSEWLLRASEGNQEILSDVGETRLSETANQIGILSAKYYFDDPIDLLTQAQAQISLLPC